MLSPSSDKHVTRGAWHCRGTTRGLHEGSGAQVPVGGRGGQVQGLEAASGPGPQTHRPTRLTRVPHRWPNPQRSATRFCLGFIFLRTFPCSRSSQACSCSPQHRFNLAERPSCPREPWRRARAPRGPLQRSGLRLPAGGAGRDISRRRHLVRGSLGPPGLSLQGTCS